MEEFQDALDTPVNLEDYAKGDEEEKEAAPPTVIEYNVRPVWLITWW